MGEWQPWETAPRDGRRIIAICNDRSRLYELWWGENRKGDVGWVTHGQTFGDGLFFANGGWVEWPAAQRDMQEVGG